MTDVTLFLREFARTRRDTGAIAPSSPLLARALTRYVIPSPGRARAVLEVGPGTGAVTRHIRASLGALDTLDLVEANPRFAELLHRDYGGDERVRLLTGLVQEHELGSYDTVVCGLPFANFDAGTVDDIFSRSSLRRCAPAARCRSSRTRGCPRCAGCSRRAGRANGPSRCRPSSGGPWTGTGSVRRRCSGICRPPMCTIWRQWRRCSAYAGW